MTTPLKFRSLLETFVVITQRTRVPNFKFIAPVVADLTLLGVVTGGQRAMVIVLYCFRSQRTISTIALRSRANFDCLTSYNSLFLRLILVLG